MSNETLRSQVIAGAVNRVIHDLMNHHFPSNCGKGQDEAFPLFWSCQQALPFLELVDSQLSDVYHRSLTQLHRVVDEVFPQFVLFWDNGQFVLKYEFYDQDLSFETVYSLNVCLTEEKVRLLLKHLWPLSVGLADVMGHNL